MYPDFTRLEQEPESRRPFLVAMGVLIVFVAGVMGLVISLAFSIRPSAATRPSLSHNVVAPARIPAFRLGHRQRHRCRRLRRQPHPRPFSRLPRQ